MNEFPCGGESGRFGSLRFETRFVRNFDLTIGLNNGLIRIRNPVRKYLKRPVNRIITDKNKSKSSVVLGRSFSVTRKGLSVSVLWNTLDTTVSIQRGRKLGYASPMRTDYEQTPNLKEFPVKECPSHVYRNLILKRIIELKPSNKMFSMRSETDDGLSSCSNFRNVPRHMN